MAIDQQLLKNVIESALLVQDKPLNIKQLLMLFDVEIEKIDRNKINNALAQLKVDYHGRGIELLEVASGFRIQARQEMEPWLAKLFQEKPPRYSRALLETLVLVAYRQPITRSEIEAVRGVSVSTHIIKTLLEREWVRVIGHKEVPGRPALYATTKEFLDYFNIKGIDELPSLSEIKDLDELAASVEISESIAVDHSMTDKLESDCSGSIVPVTTKPELVTLNVDRPASMEIGLAEFTEEDTQAPVTESLH